MKDPKFGINYKMFDVDKETGLVTGTHSYKENVSNFLKALIVSTMAYRRSFVMSVCVYRRVSPYGSVFYLRRDGAHTFVEIGRKKHSFTTNLV